MENAKAREFYLKNNEGIVSDEHTMGECLSFMAEFTAEQIKEDRWRIWKQLCSMQSLFDDYGDLTE